MRRPASGMRATTASRACCGVIPTAAGTAARAMLMRPFAPVLPHVASVATVILPVVP